MTDGDNVVARPPRDWEVQTVAVLAAVAAATVLGMLLLVTDLAVWAYVASDGASGMSPMVRGIVLNADAFDLLYLLLAFGYVAGFVWWRQRTRDMLRRLGDAADAATRHWAVGAWQGLLGMGLMIGFAISVSDAAPATTLGYTSLRVGLRVVAMAVLLIGVWEIRTQVRRAVADRGIVMRVADMPARASAFPALRPAAPAVAPPTTDLPDADDEFWDRVRQTATGLREDLALLESAGPYVHRWLIVPASGDLTEVRAAVAADAIVTVFPEPPAATETKGFTPRSAEEYYGLLQDAESGALWFRSVPSKRVPAFLAQARSAARWGLYPTADPTALTAVNRVRAAEPDPA
ncbi:hypothetical protein [Krasilnikovia sp. MM14-A1004]|uniref:hypothetical protein n=1 Tax=Krasilnikovia sp. MM14-A1004 TaxID=3373541 RepID=UPI00399D2D67